MLFLSNTVQQERQAPISWKTGIIGPVYSPCPSTHIIVAKFHGVRRLYYSFTRIKLAISPTIRARPALGQTEEVVLPVAVCIVGNRVWCLDCSEYLFFTLGCEWPARSLSCMTSYMVKRAYLTIARLRRRQWTHR